MRRKILHHLFRWATGLCAVLAVLIMALLVAAVVQRGWPALSWGFFTEQIRLVGAAGGMHPCAPGGQLIEAMRWRRTRAN